MQDAGRRNQRISIERKTVTRNAIGEEVDTWAMFRILCRSDLPEEDRVVWRSENYEIVAPPIDVSGAREVTELYCVHGIRDGR